MSVLICIGCNDYDTSGALSKLYGAENDARRVFEALTVPGGMYDPKRSVLLLSPTLSEVLLALQGNLFDPPGVVAFTFFFAGHACVAQGSLHLALRDTRGDRLSTSSLGIARIFEMIAEARPRVSNIVVDACQAGGSHYDLHTLLKPDILGKSGGASVIFLGACMADQYATEDGSGGVATVSLLRHLLGEVKLQESRPTLDLVELGQAVSEDVAKASKGSQSPACWAVALAGYGAFSGNPHYRREGAHPSFAVESVAPTSLTGLAVAANSELLWEEHRKLCADWSPARTHRALCAVVSQSGNDTKELTCFLRGISKSLRLRSLGADDLLAESDVTALVALQLLPRIGSEDGQRVARELLLEWLEIAKATLGRIRSLLREDKFLLLEGGLGEFHYAPLKFTELLGWLGAVALIEDTLGLRSTPDVGDAAAEIHGHYCRTALAISDEQAAGVYLMMAGLASRVSFVMLKDLVIRFAQSAVDCQGYFLTASASSEDIVAYTAIRAGMQVPIDSRSIARPSSLLAVVLQCAHAVRLNELDSAMRAFDGRWINSFVPSDYADFGQPMIANGLNNTQRIGFGAWTLADLDDCDGRKVRAQTLAASTHLPVEGRALCALAAHLLDDRVPYLFPLPAFAPSRSSSFGHPPTTDV